MTGSRLPTWKERENNKRRERRRRAIAANIFSGLRMYGNYKLPKHCDNNEVLKALCHEAGWTVEPDGTTYRKGCKPAEHREIFGGSAPASTCSSYQPTPYASYNPSSFPSPYASQIPSPSSISFANTPNVDPDSLIPWLKNLSSVAGSISAPVSPPLSSPTARSTGTRTDWDDQPFVSSLHSSMPPSPGCEAQNPQTGPTSPTFSLVSPNSFRSIALGWSRMWTSGQSGTCSPAIAACSDQMTAKATPDEFAFGNRGVGLVNAWEGERIHEECVSDDLELTLGSSNMRFYCR